jgi:hypothetical protein
MPLEHKRVLEHHGIELAEVGHRGLTIELSGRNAAVGGRDRRASYQGHGGHGPRCQDGPLQ